MLKKITTFIIMLLLFSLSVVAYNYQMVYNPFTGQQDYTLTSNFSDTNISVDVLTANNLSGNLTWSDLYGYPSACPADTYVTTIGDTTTCVAVSNATGNLNVVNNFTVNGVSSFDENVTIDSKLYVNNISLAQNGEITAVGGVLKFGSSTQLDDDVILSFGNGIGDFYMGDASIIYDETFSSPSTLFMGLPDSSNSVTIANYRSAYTNNFGHAQQTNPTIFLQSGNVADIAEWISLAHDQTDAVISSGQGAIKINASSKQLLLPDDHNVTWANGAKITVNSTCIILTSPAGTGEHAVCD